MTIGERIRQRRRELDMSAEALAERVGKSPATIYRYEKGDIRRVDSTSLRPIAEALKTTPAYLMGWEDGDGADHPLPANLKPASALRVQRIPLIGKVAAGVPIMAEEDYETFVDTPVKCDCALEIDGDSMVPLYEPGDIIYIKRQSDVRDGQVAVVLLNDTATLKHVYHEKDGLTLLSENHDYAPIYARKDEYDYIAVFGVPVGFTRMYRPAALGKVRKGFGSVQANP